MQIVRCYNCQSNTSFLEKEKILKAEECPQCQRDLRCCKMCAFYDPSSYNECRESNATRIVEKEKANYCDYFQLTDPKQDNQSTKENLLERANSLFKN